MHYERGAVVKGPDLLASHDSRPYIRISDETHPFSDEEGLYVALATTQRAVAVPVTDDDVASGGLPRESYANPWTIVSIRNADMAGVEGHLVEPTTEQIAQRAASYLGIE